MYCAPSVGGGSRLDKKVLTLIGYSSILLWLLSFVTLVIGVGLDSMDYRTDISWLTGYHPLMMREIALGFVVGELVIFNTAFILRDGWKVYR